MLSSFLVYPRQFFQLFYFSIYKMVNNEYSMIIYKSVKVSIGTFIKNPEMLKFVLILLKLRKCVSMQ